MCFYIKYIFVVGILQQFYFTRATDYYFLNSKNVTSHNNSSLDSVVPERNHTLKKRLVTDQCILEVNKDLGGSKEPLFLVLDRRDELQLMFPEVDDGKGVLRIGTEASVFVACPGQGNYITSTRRSLSQISCKSNTDLYVDGLEVNSKELVCASKAKAVAEITPTRCANGLGVIVSLGFKVTSDKWLELVRCCHKIDESFTYYTRHTVIGSRLKAKAKRRDSRPSFTEGSPELFKEFSASQAYSTANQEKVFARELGNEEASSYLIVPRNIFLSRGHLSPDADFLLRPHQYLTYFYVNAAPQWQSTNMGNWYLIEKAVRSRAKQLQDDFEISTGTDGVLSLQSKPIRLHESRLPVPATFWKVVRHIRSNSCIGLVTSNDPFSEQQDLLCPDVCRRTGWLRGLARNNATRGLSYCCSYRDLKAAVPQIPDMDCDRELRGS